MRRLDDRQARFLDVLEDLKGQVGVSFFRSIGKDPLDDDAGIKDDRAHGRPRLRATRIVLSLTRRALLRSCSKRSIARPLAPSPPLLHGLSHEIG